MTLQVLASKVRCLPRIIPSFNANDFCERWSLARRKEQEKTLIAVLIRSFPDTAVNR
jgi:hypothetical protein